jgi:ubiquinone/menaquinone biosynthesis C-methylase UbiE
VAEQDHEPQNLGLDHVQVAAPRTAEAQARQYYGDVLGLREIPKPEALASRGGMWFRCGELALHIGLDDEFRLAHKAHPAFVVRDLEAVRARLAAEGMAIQEDVQIPGYRRFETRDPFGNRLEFVERLGDESVRTAQYENSAPDGSAMGDGGTSAEATKARVREYFGRSAQAYVESRGHAHGRDLDRLVALAAPQRTDVALDVSTGGGHTALALAPHVARITASDLTPAMLRAARDYLTAQGVTNADYVVADAERLPFLDASFGLITVRIAPHHYTDVGAACREIARALRPDGRLVLIDPLAPEDPALDTFMNAIERRRDPSHVRNYTKREWLRMLGEAGLDVTHAEHDRKTHGFVDWVARSGMPEGDRAALERDMLAAAPAARAHFAIVERDGRIASWTCDVLIVRAVKAG